MAVVPRISGTVRYTTYETNRLDPAIPESWHSEGMHWYVFDQAYVDQHLQKGGDYANTKYLELMIETPPGVDILMNERALRALSEVFQRLGEGAPVRATMWYKASRRLGIPYKWHYIIFLEYHESPVIAIPAIVASIVIVLSAFLGGALLLRVLGFDAGSVQGLVQAPFAGTTWVFMLGTAFLVALAYFQSKSIQLKAPIRPAAPRIPQVAPTVPIEIVERARRVTR